MNATSASEQQLDQVALKQLTWKPSVIRNLAVDIVEKALAADTLWPDEISLAGLSPTDRNTVGIAWRLLTRAEVIQQTGSYRKSNADGRRSGTVFEYELKSRARAETFLKRNGRTVVRGEQQEMFGTN
jgi:hypothetical protein